MPFEPGSCYYLRMPQTMYSAASHSFLIHEKDYQFLFLGSWRSVSYFQGYIEIFDPIRIDNFLEFFIQYHNNISCSLASSRNQTFFQLAELTDRNNLSRLLTHPNLAIRQFAKNQIRYFPEEE